MNAVALEAEVKQHVKSLHHLRDGNGYAPIVGNGRSHDERTVRPGVASFRIQAPRMDDRQPEHRFANRILPPYM
jgi:hypothetical protein